MDENSSDADSRWRELYETGHYDHLDPFLSRMGKFVDPGFSAEPEEVNARKEFFFEICRILVIGAGGLGCELLKDLALVGFHDIHVIDLDTIDISNLNRQFLFRNRDISRPKAVVAAEFVNSRVTNACVTPHFGKIEDFDEDFYASFDMVVAGLDSVGARRWLNQMLVNLVRPIEEGEKDVDVDTIVPLIDGGTEGLKGHARIIIPKMSSCFHCTLSLIPPATLVPMCTIANTPRQPEHCVEYVSQVEWPKEFPDRTLDVDDDESLDWVFNLSKKRADLFKIEGLTRMMCKGVVKRIIPAVSSTNAIIAAVSANEAFKMATQTCCRLSDFIMFNGDVGMFTHTYSNIRDDRCPICSDNLTMEVAPSLLLSDLIEQLRTDHRLTRPDITVSGRGFRTLFINNPPSMKDACMPNLKKTVDQLMQNGEMLMISDAVLSAPLKIAIVMKMEP